MEPTTPLLQAPDAWDSLLTSISECPEVPANDDLTLFYGSVGSQYRRELLVVGRAVNGWIPRFKKSDLVSTEQRTRLVESERTRLAKEGCQMAWVRNRWRSREGYNTARSAFWRVARSVTQNLAIGADADWSSHLAWSNLYRVAPYETGNPPTALVRAQRDGCRQVLASELVQLQPKRILFLTGRNWLRPFEKTAGLELRNDGEDGVEAVGLCGEAAVVVAQHPQGKAEAPMVDAILRGFGMGNAENPQ